MDQAKLKEALVEIINLIGSGDSQRIDGLCKLLNDAFNPVALGEQKHTCHLGCMLGYCAVVQGLKEPSKQKETGENKTREQKQHESNIAVENNKAGFFFGYQKGREDRTAEIQGYLNQPGLEEESAFFKELLKNV